MVTVVSGTLQLLKAGLDFSSAEEMRSFAAELAMTLPLDCILLLSGDLGTGKTTFVQGLARGFAIDRPISSPSFNLLFTYKGRINLYHIDAYRLARPLDLEDFALDDLLVSPFCIAIEWPDRVLNLPANLTLKLDFQILPNGHHALHLLEGR